jgi:hypothetical protein
VNRPKQRRQSSRYWSRVIRAAHNELANPKATSMQRSGARRRLNRAVDVLNALEPISLMSREKRETLLSAKRQSEAAA